MRFLTSLQIRRGAEQWGITKPPLLPLFNLDQPHLPYQELFDGHLRPLRPDMHFSIDTISRYKPHLQATIFSLALLGFILSVVRLALPGSIPSRMNIWILVVASPTTPSAPSERLTDTPLKCLKSMLILTYEVLTERNTRFQKWASKKANLILNCIEPVFWLAAFVLSAMGVSTRCHGAICRIGTSFMLVALILV